MKNKRFIAALLAFAIMLGMVGCGKAPNDEDSKETDPKSVTEVTMVVDENTISKLDNYPSLKKADLTGSTCYAALAAYAKAHPEVEVIYTVSVGSGTISANDTEATLNDGTYDFEKLLELAPDEKQHDDKRYYRYESRRL